MTSDRTDHYIKLRKRAGDLRDLLDDCIHRLMRVELAAQEVAKADLGVPGELSLTDQVYLERSVADALYYTKMTEKINNGHVENLDCELRKLGVDPLSITANGE